jgi:hypothetical protein
MWTKRTLAIGLLAALAGCFGGIHAAETGKEEKGADEQPPAPAPAKDDIVAKVDDAIIRQSDIKAPLYWRGPGPFPTEKERLQHAIHRILWSRYIDKQGLWPSETEVRRALPSIDSGPPEGWSSPIPQAIADRDLWLKEQLSLVRYDLAMKNLARKFQPETKPEEIKAEFEAHPDWYDGTKIRLSKILIDTRNLDKTDQDRAKERIDLLYFKLTRGDDFGRLADDYSESHGAGVGGDRGWFIRKGAETDEALIASVWNLKAGECTKPILTDRGWQILKVTEREGPAFTFIGSRPGIQNELVRRRLDALLVQLKAAAKIEILMKP